MKNPVTQKLLKEYFEYDPDTGNFKRIKRSGKKGTIGKIAGSLSRDGGIDIRFCGRLHRAHRLAWLYMTGEWPRWSIDHINSIRTDNRWCNLRDIPQNINMQNMRDSQKGSKCGVLGVSLLKGRFRARIKLNYREYHIGMFDTEEEAHAAYVDAKRKIHAGCTI